jgi:hypothetical protein
MDANETTQPHHRLISYNQEGSLHYKPSRSSAHKTPGNTTMACYLENIYDLHSHLNPRLCASGCCTEHSAFTHRAPCCTTAADKSRVPGMSHSIIDKHWSSKNLTPNLRTCTVHHDPSQWPKENFAVSYDQKVNSFTWRVRLPTIACHCTPAFSSLGSVSYIVFLLQAMSFMRAALLVLALGLAQGQTTTKVNITVTDPSDGSTSLVENATIVNATTSVETVTAVNSVGIATKEVTGANATEVTSADRNTVTTTITLSNVGGVITTQATKIVKSSTGALVSTAVTTQVTKVDLSTNSTTVTTAGNVETSSTTTVTAPLNDQSDKTSIKIVKDSTSTVTTNTDASGSATTTFSSDLTRKVVTSADGVTEITSITNPAGTVKSTTAFLNEVGVTVRTLPEITVVTRTDKTTLTTTTVSSIDDIVTTTSSSRLSRRKLIRQTLPTPKPTLSQ